MYPHSDRTVYGTMAQWVVTLRDANGKESKSYQVAPTEEKAKAQAVIYYTVKPEIVSVVRRK